MRIQPARLAGILTDWMYNVQGVESPDQVQAAVAAEAANRVQASGGTLSLADATAQVSAEYNQVLTLDKAAPNQLSIGNTLSTALNAITTGNPMTSPDSSSLLQYLLIGGIVVFSGIAAVNAIKR